MHDSLITALKHRADHALLERGELALEDGVVNIFLNYLLSENTRDA